jgi:[CysO sulfur-carrier protein]-S-L-cysteine hydrolase
VLENALTRRPRRYPPGILEAIARLAEAETEREVCGLVTAQPGGMLRVVPVENVADRYHALDPARFPGTARLGFFMEPSRLAQVLEEIDDTRGEVAAVYHSHVEAGAYLSAKDREEAVVGGIQQIPGAEYLVVGVRNGLTREIRRFFWDGRDFEECALERE